MLGCLRGAIQKKAYPGKVKAIFANGHPACTKQSHVLAIVCGSARLLYAESMSAFHRARSSPKNSLHSRRRVKNLSVDS